MRDPFRKDTVVIAWLVAAFALPLLPIMANSDRLVVLAPADLVAVLVAVPVATVGSLVLIVRRLSRPDDKDAADYDDELKTEPIVKPDSWQ